MKQEQTKRAVAWREKHPLDLIASDVTVAELITFLQTLPPELIVYAVDAYNDEHTQHIQVETDLDSNRVLIRG